MQTNPRGSERVQHALAWKQGVVYWSWAKLPITGIVVKVDCREGRVEWRHEGALTDKEGRFHLVQSTYSCISDIPCPLPHPFSIESLEVLFPPPLPYKRCFPSQDHRCYTYKVERLGNNNGDGSKRSEVAGFLCVCLSVSSQTIAIFQAHSNGIELNWILMRIIFNFRKNVV